MDDIVTFISLDNENRLDKLCTENTNFSRNKLNKLIKNGNVDVDGITITKPSYIVKQNQKIQIIDSLPQIPLSASAENIPINVIYEDDDFAVLSKPFGMVVHPSPGNYTGTLVNALLFHYDKLSTDNMRPGIVHRLDKDTSGIIIIAKNDYSHQALSLQLQNKSMSKHYLALIAGNMKEISGSIIKPISRDKKNRKKMAIDPSGRYAETHWQLIENLKGSSLLLIKIITGRTHQIRIHMSSISRPIIGDPIYNSSYKQNTCRLMLHAYSLEFNHPRTNKRLYFKCDLPVDYINILKKSGINMDNLNKYLNSDPQIRN